MAESDVFAIASRHAAWLLFRQKTIAENVAHADFPGFKALDVAPTAGPSGAGSQLTTTDARHFDAGGATMTTTGRKRPTNWETTHSGNSVNLDQQLLRANEVRTAYNLNAGVVKSFNRMLLASVKG